MARDSLRRAAEHEERASARSAAAIERGYNALGSGIAGAVSGGMEAFRDVQQQRMAERRTSMLERAEALRAQMQAQELKQRALEGKVRLATEQLKQHRLQQQMQAYSQELTLREQKARADMMSAEASRVRAAAMAQRAQAYEQYLQARKRIMAEQGSQRAAGLVEKSLHWRGGKPFIFAPSGNGKYSWQEISEEDARRLERLRAPSLSAKPRRSPFEDPRAAASFLTLLENAELGLPEDEVKRLKLELARRLAKGFEGAAQGVAGEPQPSGGLSVEDLLEMIRQVKQEKQGKGGGK